MKIGSIGWIDLSVEDAEGIKEFYQDVVGWRSSPVPVGDHEDYSMHPAGEEDPVAGICHALGENAAMPRTWLIYVVVADLDASLATCERRGGEVLAAPRAVGEDRFAVIADPAGAACALYEPGS